MNQQMQQIKERGVYSGSVCLSVEVADEFYLREWNRLIIETAPDLSSQAEVEALRAKLANPLYWQGKPQAKVTYLPAAPAPVSLPVLAQEETREEEVEETKYVSLYDQLKERVVTIPPHAWESDLQEAMPEELVQASSEGMSDEQKREIRRRKQYIWNRNSRIRTMLSLLLQELKRGELTLSPEAQAEEERYQREQEEKTVVQTKSLALLTSTSRLTGNFASNSNGNLVTHP